MTNLAGMSCGAGEPAEIIGGALNCHDAGAWLRIWVRSRITARSNALNIKGFIRATREWLGRQDSNLGMAVPKTAALPLGDAPKLVESGVYIVGPCVRGNRVDGTARLFRPTRFLRLRNPRVAAIRPPPENIEVSECSAVW